MNECVVVLAGDATPRDPGLEALLDESRLVRDRLSWEAIAQDGWSARRACGVLAVATPHSAAIEAALARLQSQRVDLPTLVILPGDSEERVVEQVLLAADDFVFAPIQYGELRHRLRRLFRAQACESEVVREQLFEELGMARLIGRDPRFVSAVESIPRYARSGMPVLITGETGTGKELCARALHHLGPRRDFPFIAVDCSTLPDHLFENELFGHARGAYTDAHRDQRGLVAMAAGGTLFLDEIDALSLPAQGKLLRLLQEHQYRPLGSPHFETADVNVLAATNGDVEALAAAKQFRSDLYHRLDVLRLRLPPLRDRLGDIAALAQHFLDERIRSGTTSVRTIAAGALRLLARHTWPGNVRELANVVARASVTCDGRQIQASHLSFGAADPATVPDKVEFRTARAATVEAFERRFIEELLAKHGGNVTHAAREAGKDRRVFGRMMKRYGIAGTSFRSAKH